MIGVAALSLAACGSGGGESTDPTRKSLLDQREKQLTQREASVSQKEKDQAAKDRQQAAKDKELNNRPPRVVTRTVTSPRAEELDAKERTLADKERELAEWEADLEEDYSRRNRHVGFSGGVFSGDQIKGLSRVVFDMQQYPLIWLSSPTVSPGLVYTKLSGSEGSFLFPKLIPFDDSSGVRRTKLNVYKVEGIDYDSGLVATKSGRYLTDDEYKIYELTTSTPIDNRLTNKFSYERFKREVYPRKRDTTSTAEFHAEVASDYGGDTSDWLQFGWWVQVPNQTDRLDHYNVGVFANANHAYKTSSVAIFRSLTGTVAYTGSMMGLHSEVVDNGKIRLSRFSGNATLVAAFGSSSDLGTLTGIFNNLKLNGTAAKGSIRFSHPLEKAGTAFEYFDNRNVATINGRNYKGGIILKWVNSTDADATAKPTGIIGTLKGIARDGDSSFAATFGARPE